MQIKNVAAIVTGGGSGLGAATAAALAGQGAKVAILDANIKTATDVANDINGIAIACDVTDEQAVINALAEASTIHGVPRICVNCAGICPGARILGRDNVLPLSDFSKVININLIGTFNVLRLVAEAMSKLETKGDDHERGVIINTASIAAFEGQIGQAAYSASKGAVASLTLPAARELARFGIRVMCIAPGVFATNMVEQMPQSVQDSLASSIPFPKRLGHPSEFAKTVLHIIENSMLNGSIIRLDGAMRMSEK